MADLVKMSIGEEKNAIVYTFGFGYVDKGEDLKWNEKAVIARRTGDKWSFDFNAFANQPQVNLGTYQKMLEKVNQVVETGGTNLFGITVEKPKPAKADA